MTDFSGPLLKLERAEQHIRNLEIIFAAHINSNTKKLFPNRNRNRRKDTARVIGTPFPRHTPTILGDTIHNLRASLDHAYCMLVESNKGTITKWTFFPFGKDRQSVEGSVNGTVKTGSAPSSKVISTIFDEIQPFENGRLKLYGLHLLDITDKHSSLIPTASVTNLDGVVIRNPDGTIRNKFHNFSIIVPSNVQANAMVVGAGMTTENYGDAKNAFDIRFGQGQPFEGESILTILKTLSVNVNSALNLLDIASKEDGQSEAKPIDSSD